MKRNLLLAAVLLSTPVFADIPAEENHIQSLEYEGEAAEKLCDALDVKVIPGDSLRTRISSYKVLRAEDGLFQIVCKDSKAQRKRTVSAAVQVSLDGRELPKFTPPPRRVG